MGNSNDNNKGHWIAFWGTVSNAIIVGVFGLLTIVIATILASRNNAPSTPDSAPSPQASGLSIAEGGYGKVLSADNPYPESMGVIMLGMRLSAVKALRLSGGTLDATTYSFEVPSGPFKSVICQLDSAEKEGNDPNIERISYLFRDESAGTLVRRQAVTAFGSKKLKSEASGEVMRWPNIQGCKVEIDASSYKLAP